ALVANCCGLAVASGGENTSGTEWSPTRAFKEVVKEYFGQWDSDGDGTLSRDEVNAAVGNPKFRGEAAAAIAAIELVVRSPKYTLPPITEHYLLSSPLREASDSDEENASRDDVSKPEKFEHLPAFQPRYVY